MQDHYRLINVFNRYFEVIEANTGQLKQKVFEIRHAVYCEELGWEAQNAQKIEKDPHDPHSHHFLMRHKESGEYVGCARLCMPDPTNDNAQLPFEQNCLASLIEGQTDPRTLKKGQYGEVSRVAVLSSFRRRLKDGNVPYTVIPSNKPSAKKVRSFPFIAIGLYMSVAARAALQGHDGFFMMMEPRLRRQLDLFGLNFEQVGENMEYHGQRALYFLSCEELLALPTDLSELLQDIKHKMSGAHAKVNDVVVQLPRPEEPNNWPSAVNDGETQQAVAASV